MSTEDHRLRYRLAMELGLVPAISPEQLSRVSFFILGEQSPELVPMWQAFNAVTSLSEATDGAWVDVAARDLVRFGLSKSGAARSADRVRWHLESSQNEAQRLGPLQLEFVGMLRGASRGEQQQLLRDGRLDLLTDFPTSERGRLTELYRAWRRDPVADSACSSIESLRKELSPSDWEALRDYLFVRIAPGLTMIDTDHE